MIRRWSHCCLIALILLIIFGINAVRGEDGKLPDALRDLRVRFESEEKILSKPLSDLYAKYREYLANQGKAYQNSGNLNGVLEVEKVLKLFDGSPARQLSSFYEIKRLQEIYRKQHELLEGKRRKLKLNLLREFQKSAVTIAKQSTKEGRIEDAKLAETESKRFAAMQKAIFENLSAPKNLEFFKNATNSGSAQNPVVPKIPKDAVHHRGHYYNQFGWVDKKIQQENGSGSMGARSQKAFGETSVSRYQVRKIV